MSFGPKIPPRQRSQLSRTIPPIQWQAAQGGEQEEVSTQHRLRYSKAYPDAYKMMLALTQAVERTGLAPQLSNPVNFRVSQLNGCAFCLDMHSKDLHGWNFHNTIESTVMSAWLLLKRNPDRLPG